VQAKAKARERSQKGRMVLEIKSVIAFNEKLSLITSLPNQSHPTLTSAARVVTRVAIKLATGEAAGTLIEMGEQTREEISATRTMVTVITGPINATDRATLLERTGLTKIRKPP